MRTAVHFGAGNIGRGFIGLLLHHAGYEVVFADVVPGLVEQLDRDRMYRVLTLDEQVEEAHVTGVRAVLIGSPDCVREIALAEVVTTAVGLGNLDSTAAVIAEGLRLRREQNAESLLNVLACENAVRATSTLRDAVLRHVGDRADLQTWIADHVGFADVAVDRIAPNREGYATLPLDAVVERFFEWDVEKAGLVAPLKVPGATLVDELDPYLERKLFILNSAHATAAYAGYHKGLPTILEAMRDKDIARLVEAVQLEAAAALAVRHKSLTLPALTHYAESVRARFLNPHIHDQVERVGRDPLRKLSAPDRLVSPLLLAQKAGLPTPALIEAIALGLHYDNSADEAAVRVQDLIREHGVMWTAAQVTGIGDELVLGGIVEQYGKL
ncbi:mannitol-1-phosphate 5-dehydrogenase [Alicyclobacillus sp. ALC3]|uniref:mannitol-1-phosphate 5-dehydrogenase n=1 Tax=Alicyclobacillus sp. ALC3 TaxID=2796143 RepID=UPI002378B4DA|nr:mannitol-1-phosphate 5-dehydrogenase [Alicyclobacillus sp. ALC3]WDL99072.1 mannitol-1-phosphate 5-dehydrogenase [Alicyclobacillus sp. ALC3]